ncbi:hypothetical protein [Candidatus Borrarchaeum sp.]|uniref:hypothetical protein n=1 Tax=Candidatus Borrarchaeum sp. TaxID=2846742 RepID=UPI00257E6D39|nr:hypothetical protein [Candidatus Borrarchaeum sp.]
MDLFRFFRRKDYSRNFLNRMVIGLGVGLVKSRTHILSPDFGPQGSMDVLATWMGQEVAKELLNQKKINTNSSKSEVIESVLDEVRIAEDLEISFDNNSAHIAVQQCLICPRRVGGYDLEGHTACPVGGILRGAINLVTGKSPQVKRIALRPAEICQIDFELS